MQLYPISLNAGNQRGTSISAHGHFIYFESGSVNPSTGDPHLRISTDNGDDILLKPGQGFKLPKKCTSWRLSVLDGTSDIAGTLLIGDGEFNDNNTQNLITLAASNVPNAAALPVKKQQLATLTNFAVATINTGAAQALVSDPTQAILRIRNTHASANLYLGAAGVTSATAAVVLGPGDLWNEEEAAGAAWYATSDTNGCTVAILGLKL